MLIPGSYIKFASCATLIAQLCTQQAVVAMAQVATQQKPIASTLHFRVGADLVSFKPNQVQITSGPRTFRVAFVNANVTAAQHKQAAKANESSSSPADKRKVLPLAQADQVVYKNLWAGIDLAYEQANRQLKSTYYVAPFANPSQIRLRYNVPVRVLADGGLQWQFADGVLKESAPVAWQEIGKQRKPVQVRFEAGNMPNDVRLKVANYDASRPLVIDPTYEWHAFYGHAGYDLGQNVAVDAAGEIFAVGLSRGTWLGPAGESPLHDHSGGDDDIFIVKLSPAGDYLWHTFFGGPGKEFGWDVVPLGNAIFVQAASDQPWNGPSGQAPLHAHSGGNDSLVMRLSNSGAYVWHTFYGSDAEDTTWGFGANDTSLVVCGHGPKSWNGPSGQAPLHAFSGTNDVYVFKLNLNGVYQWHTFYGSSGHDQCGDIEMDGAGNVYLSGESHATWQGPSGQDPLHAHTGTPDAFVMKLNGSGNYVWHTFYGSGTSTGLEVIQDLQYDAVNVGLYVVGSMLGSFNGPGNVAPLNAYTGGYDVFAMRLNLQGGYLWHVFYGAANSNEFGGSSSAGPDGSVYVGIASGGHWDGPGGIRPIGQFVGNPYDAAYLKLSVNGSYQWHMFFGSNGDDQATNMALQPGSHNRMIGVGYSSATWNGPNTSAPLRPHSGNMDAFIVKVLDETPVTIQFGQPFTSVLENVGGGFALVPVLLSSSSAETVTVGFETQDGTATAGSDYTAKNGTLTFLPGQMVNSIALPIANDSADEPDETLRISLVNPTRATLGAPKYITLTIADDDDPNLETAPNQITFNAVQGGNNPNAQMVSISGVTAWQAMTDTNWIVLSNAVGNMPGDVSVSANISGLTQGSYTGTITVNAPGATNSTRRITTRLIVAAPGGADQFEGDDGCPQAKPISTDGAVQPHSFHQQNDADWTTFNAISGTTYVIQAQRPPGSTADVTLEVYANCSAFPQTQNHAFSPGVRLEYLAATNGPVYAKWSNKIGSVYGASVLYNVSVNTRSSTPDLGAVVIIAGRFSANDSLQPNIHNVTSNLYRVFLEHGYSADRIQYLATDLTIPGVDGLPTLANVQATLEVWARQYLANGRSLTLYMMDHGGPDVFYLDGTGTQELTPQALDGWLAGLEAQYSGLKINIIIDACYSGSFIAEPNSISRPGRVVIASTRPDYLAYASATGAIFSDHFVGAVSRGQSMFDSFLRANWSTTLAYPDQRSMLDDNGDHVANTPSDGAEAQRRGFSFVGTFGPDTLVTQSWPPYIEQAESVAVTSTTASRKLRARVFDNSRVDNVYAVIYPPDYRPPTAQSRLVSETLPTATLLSEGDNWFSASWPGFTQLGQYRIVIYARDDKGEPAQPVELFFNNGRFVYLPFIRR